jgi:hypothetical protein
MAGTIQTLDDENLQEMVHAKVVNCSNIAESAGATAEVASLNKRL